MDRRFHPPTLFASFVLAALMLPASAFAVGNPSYTEIGHNINIGPNDQVSELTCVFCSVRVSGQVAGDITVVAGNVVIEDQAQIAGDITAVGGDVRLDHGVKVAGDATVVGGDLRRDPQAIVSGDVTSVGGHGWAIPILLSPFIILGLFVALVVWLVQRTRRPAVPVAAA
jgi:hypothetical protein